MKLQSYEFSRNSRKDTGLMDCLEDIGKILNLGRYQLRIVTTVPTHTGDAGEILLYISTTVRGLYWYDPVNSTWQFLEWNSSGLAHATVVATVSLTGQTASIGATTLYTPAIAGQYRVSVYHLCSKAGTGGTLDTTISWSDVTQAQSTTPAIQIDLTGKGNASSGNVFIRSTATAITYATTVAGEAGAPEYDLYVVVERLG